MPDRDGIMQKNIAETSNSDEILALLEHVIESNGDFPAAKKEQLRWVVLRELYRMVLPLSDKIEHLERWSILLWAGKNKAAAGVVVAVFFIILTLWHDVSWRPVIYKLLGIPLS
jgi:hypothetical protein